MHESKRDTPAKRDAIRTRAKILECATEAFSRAGFKGTSLTDILKKARVNKRMVYHYFGSKEGLYRLVHLEQWKALQAWFAQAISGSSQGGAFTLDNERLLLEAIGIFHDFVGSHPTFIRLLMWDGLEGGRVSRSLWKDIRGPLYEAMEGLILGAQENGVLPRELKPDHLVVSVMGEISFYFAYANSLRDIFGGDPLRAEAVAERKRQVLEHFRRILLPNP